VQISLTGVHVDQALLFRVVNVFGDTWQALLTIDHVLLLRAVDASLTWPSYDEVFSKTVELRPTGISITRLSLGSQLAEFLGHVFNKVCLHSSPHFCIVAIANLLASCCS
jgi:hypothetical protein